MMIEALARQGGADPLAAAISQHADMVYATCRRVLGSEAEAADVAQETFFQFLKQAGRIRGTAGGWLHQVATRRSIDLIRQSASRRRREEAYASESSPVADTWREVEPLVDEALEALDPEAREILVLHHLQGRSMSEIAAAKGISQPTVSRRIASALEELREILRGKGVLVAAGTLGSLLTGALEAAPATLMQALGKMALAHTAAGATATAAGSWLGGGGKLAAIVAGGAMLVGTGWWALRPRPPASVPLTNLPPATVTYGFSTSVVWTTGPGGQGTRVFTSGTNFAITNQGPAAVGPATEAP